MSVALRKRKNSDGSTSLFLDIYYRGKRTYEFLPEVKLRKASTKEDRAYNNKMLDIAKQIQGERMKEAGEKLVHRSTITALKYFQSYVDGYTKSDLASYKGMLGKLKKYLSDAESSGLLMSNITESHCLNFRDHLSKGSVGEGAASYFSKFKRIVKRANKEGVLPSNPCEDVKLPRGKAGIKNTLTAEEIQKIVSVETKAPDIKFGFLFACMTGLRYVDVKKLNWDSIDVQSAVMKLRQSKTGDEVIIQLNSSAISILEKTPHREGQVFKISKAAAANESLKTIIRKAGITKRITWHCARHSFGTNLIFHGADVYSTSRLLGHASVKQTQRYVRAAEELKQQAVNKLPEIKL